MQTYQDKTGTLMANSHPGSYCGQDAYSDMLVAGPTFFESHPADSRVKEIKDDISPTMSVKWAKGSCDTPLVMGVNFRAGTESEDVCGTLQAKATGGWNLNDNNAIRNQMVVRRLTPLECERLQGYPDGWTLIGEPEEKEVIDYAYTYDEEGNEVDKVEVGRHTETEYFYTDANGKRKKCTDSARYKALGNSIALPPWKWVLKRICACYERDATMASLFDGIGGFPLIWEQLNGKGSCLWASEIEEFPIAVTKLRFE